MVCMPLSKIKESVLQTDGWTDRLGRNHTTQKQNANCGSTPVATTTTTTAPDSSQLPPSFQQPPTSL